MDDQYLSAEEVLANATRIVACVNACAGIKNPEAVKDLLKAAEFACTIKGFGVSGIIRLRAAILRAQGDK